MLSEIAFRSKAHWNYPTKWLSLWENDLKVTSEDIYDNHCWVIQNQSGFSGFLLAIQESEFLSIEHFWIDPKYIGKGYGGELMSHFLSQPICQQKIQVISDPYAEGFYKKYGFQKINEIASSIPNRNLPLLERDL